MDIRKIIRETVERVFQEQGEGGDSMFGDSLMNIDDQLAKDQENVALIIKTQQIDMKNKDNEIKSDLQLKSKLDAKNPHKKGLEREIPEKQKDYEDRKKQLKDLEDAQKGLEAARKEIQKQKLDMEKQSQTSKVGEKEAPASNLPSLESPI